MPPVLVVFSVGLQAMGVFFAVVGLASRQSVWAAVALRDLEAGLAGSAAAGILAVAAVTGTAPGSRARRLAVGRAAAQIGAVALLGAALVREWSGRAAAPEPGLVVLATGGLGLAALAVWLSRELDGRLGDAQGRTARTKPSARW